MLSKIAVAAALVAAPLVSATGQAVVENRCDFPVYLWSVSNSDGEMHTVDANNGNYSETYRTNSNGGGVSIKIARDQAQSSITQFEYTLDNSLWYDVSNINGYPFEDWGLTLVPSEASCRNILCQAGVSSCSDAYNVPSDNHATSACSTDADTVLVLCSDQQSDSDVSDTASSAAADAGSILKVADVTPANNVAQTTPPPAAPTPAPVQQDNSNDNVVTTFATEWVTVDAAAATPAPAAAAAAPAADGDESQWFGHHEAGWSPKARRHVHHPHGAHAAHE